MARKQANKVEEKAKPVPVQVGAVEEKNGPEKSVTDNKATKELKVKKPRMSRADKIKKVVEGRNLKLVSPDVVVEPFTCICGGKGKNAYILIDEISGEQIKVGKTCLGHCGIEVPRKRRAKKETVPQEVKNAEPIVESASNETIADLD